MKVEVKKNTDQLNYEDFIGGIVRIVTIADVKKGAKEAQYDIAIEGDDRYWRPPPTVLKMLAKAWGDEGVNWVGRRAELYGDPNVDSPAMKKAGGIRCSRVSHITEPVSEMLTVTRGKKARFTLDPLPDAAPLPELTEADRLRAEWRTATPERKAAIEAEVAALGGSQ